MDTRLFHLLARQQLRARNLECELAANALAGDEWACAAIKDELIVARSRARLVHRATP